MRRDPTRTAAGRWVSSYVEYAMFNSLYADLVELFPFTAARPGDGGADASEAAISFLRIRPSLIPGTRRDHYAGFTTRYSMRRLRNLPSNVSLVATGLALP